MDRSVVFVLVVLAILFVVVGSLGFLLSVKAPLPTPTPSGSFNVPSSEPALEPVLILPGDLPEELSAGEITHTVEGLLRDYPKADRIAQQELKRDNQDAGAITVLIYKSKGEAQEAYRKLVEDFGVSGMQSVPKTMPLTWDTQTLDNVGENAFLLTATQEDGTLAVIQAGFVRCRAVVIIRVFHTSNLLALTTYANNLDGRLASRVCRE